MSDVRLKSSLHKKRIQPFFLSPLSPDARYRSPRPDNPTCLGAFNTTRYNLLEQRVNALEDLLAGLNETLLAKIIHLSDVMSV